MAQSLMLDGVPQFVPSSVCLNCDGCCRFDREHNNWRPKVGNTEREFLTDKIFPKEMLDHKHFIVMEDYSEHQCRCTFFNTSDGTCRIYHTRPFECKLYPFLLFSDGGKTVVGAHLSCPHINKTYQSQEYREFLPRLKAYFDQPHVIEFVRKNPDIIQDYSAYRDEITVEFEVKL